MSEENATLRDGSVVTEVESPAAPVVKEPETPIVIDDTDKNAAEVGRILLESGVTMENLNDLLAAPRALATLRAMVTQDPKSFVQELRRTDPEAADNFQQKIADYYVEQYGDRGANSGGEEKGKDTKTTELERKVDELRAETDRLRTKDQQRDAAIASASNKERYNNRVKELFEQEPIKKLGLTKVDQKNLKARLDVELAQDQQAVTRISNGNYVDVPKAFKGLVEELASDRKAAAEGEKEEREGVNARMFPEFISGADSFSAQIPEKVFDSWDATEEGFAAALRKFSK